MMFDNIMGGLRSSSNFFRSVMVLVTGTVAAQLIMLIALPLLTRLYSPEDFSVLAIYASLTGIISVAACLGLDVAVSMPESDEESNDLLVLAVFFATIISVATGSTLYLLDRSFLMNIGFEKLLPFLWMIPVGIFVGALYNAIQFYAVRKKAFPEISKTKIGQSSVAAFSQLGWGAAGVTPFGLLLGQMLSGGIGFFYLYFKLINKEKLFAISLAKLKKTFLKYKKFPQFTTFEILINSAGIQIPVILIASLIVGSEAGFLFLAMRVMQIPMSLIGGAISQVYLASAPDEHRKDNLAAFTEKILGGLIKAGVGPIAFAGIIAPLAFSVVFGADWGRAGVLVAWMTPWFVFQFLASPISMVMHVKNMQRLMLNITVLGLILRVGALLCVSMFSKDVLSECYAVASFVFYFCCFFIFSMHAGLSTKNLISTLFKNYLYILPWIVFALVLRQLYYFVF